MAEQNCKALNVLTAHFSVSRAAFAGCASTPTDIQECQDYVGRSAAIPPFPHLAGTAKSGKSGGALALAT
jgi:hypothetical protein